MSTSPVASSLTSAIVSPLVTVVERIDDIPLLLAQMEKLQLAKLLDEQFSMHGNWDGLTLGDIVQIWLAYILSEGDHRLNHVESWVDGLKNTLEKCFGKEVRSLDFSDDRLAIVLSCLGDDEKFEQFEGILGQTILRVYDLKPSRVRIDSTTAKSYTTSVTDEGLFQFGHSKDHRPDLPQLKINQSALDPLGIPLTTTIVSGEKADDPLYIPEIVKVQKIINSSGVLFVGDCKMASMKTRAYVAKSGDYYLCPLSSVQMPDTELANLLNPVWNNEQKLTDVYNPLEDEGVMPVKIAEGFTYTATLQLEIDGEMVEWNEERSVVHSFKHAKKQEKALEAQAKKAQASIEKLNKHGPGIKRLDKNALQNAVDKILKEYRCIDFLDVEYDEEITEIPRKAYGGREAYTLIERKITVHTVLNTKAWENTIRSLGWRVFVCNDKELTLSEAVLAYRQEYLIEHGFARYKGKTLGLTPIYLSSEIRIKGLIRLLCIGLRVLCLLEFTARQALKKEDEKLSGIYKGNPKRSTNSPTAEMMLKAFRGISFIIIEINKIKHAEVTPLSEVQKNILLLLNQSDRIYYGLAGASLEPTVNLSER
jgi:transposase